MGRLGGPGMLTPEAPTAWPGTWESAVSTEPMAAPLCSPYAPLLSGWPGRRGAPVAVGSSGGQQRGLQPAGSSLGTSSALSSCPPGGTHPGSVGEGLGVPAVGQAGHSRFRHSALARAEGLSAVGMAFPIHGKNSFAQRLGPL